MKRQILVGAVLVLGLIPVVCAFAQSDTDMPVTITVNAPGRFPEGIEWDAEGQRYFLGSLTDGSVVAVTDDGTVTPFAEAPEAGLVSLGLQADLATSRLLVAYADIQALFNPEATGRAGLGIFDLTTGELIRYVDVSDLYEGRHLGNDVAVDDVGNAYLTDSFSPVIYRVTPEGDAEVFISDERLGDPNHGFGLNGIEFVADGYLLAAVDGTASLWKIAIDDPTAMTQVELDKHFAADGMGLLEDGSLVAVARVIGADSSVPAEPSIIMVTSDDDWASAAVTSEVDGTGTSTLTIRDNQVYAIVSLLAQLGSQTVPQSYDIKRIDFPESM